MPRKPLEITHEFPYHISARSNNKEWFYLPIDQCWKIFSSLLVEVSIRFQFQTHAFVLMNNHYHLIGSAAEDFPLPKVMEWLQRSANRIINQKAGRINHLFGGPYKGSLIKSEGYYLHAIKYLYRNPVQSGLVCRVEDYPYSTLRGSPIPLVSPITGIASQISHERTEFLNFLNEDYSLSSLFAIRKAIGRSEFRLPKRLESQLAAELKLRK